MHEIQEQDSGNTGQEKPDERPYLKIEISSTFWEIEGIITGII